MRQLEGAAKPTGRPAIRDAVLARDLQELAGRLNMLPGGGRVPAKTIEKAVADISPKVEARRAAEARAERDAVLSVLADRLGKKPTLTRLHRETSIERENENLPTLEGVTEILGSEEPFREFLAVGFPHAWTSRESVRSIRFHPRGRETHPTVRVSDPHQGPAMIDVEFHDAATMPASESVAFAFDGMTRAFSSARSSDPESMAFILRHPMGTVSSWEGWKTEGIAALRSAGHPDVDARRAIEKIQHDLQSSDPAFLPWEASRRCNDVEVRQVNSLHARQIAAALQRIHDPKVRNRLTMMTEGLVAVPKKTDVAASFVDDLVDDLRDFRDAVDHNRMWNGDLQWITETCERINAEPRA